MKQLKSTKVTHLLQIRVFSEEIRRSTVQNIEQGKCTVSQTDKELEVINNNICRWIFRYNSCCLCCCIGVNNCNSITNYPLIIKSLRKTIDMSK